jgi:serine/threonine protein kinase
MNQAIVNYSEATSNERWQAGTIIGHGVSTPCPAASADQIDLALCGNGSHFTTEFRKWDLTNRIAAFEAAASGSSVANPLRYGHFEVSLDSDGLPDELGSGAMATTYRATDTRLRRQVALKVISRRVAANPIARARFLREARAAARIHHPNVANVTFYGEERGECYYAMELVEGETLAARVQRCGKLNSSEVLEIGMQVARALVAAEACGVVHCDLKPSNLMVTDVPEAGDYHGDRTSAAGAAIQVKVIDWGLVKSVDSDDHFSGGEHTRNGFVGTPAFASPEQFACSAEQRIDLRSDIYSLGVTLWYLLCGRTPFVGDTLEAIHARQRELPLKQLKAAKVPNHLVAVLRSMLAFDPAHRPQNPRELLAILHRCRRHYLNRYPVKVAASSHPPLALVANLLSTTFTFIGKSSGISKPEFANA